MNVYLMQWTSTNPGAWREIYWQNLLRYFYTPQLKYVAVAEHYQCGASQSFGQSLLGSCKKGNTACAALSVQFMCNIVKDKYLRIVFPANRKATVNKIKDIVRNTFPLQNDELYVQLFLFFLMFAQYVYC